MRPLTYFIIIILFLSCGNDSKKALQICDCMDLYEINYNESHLQATKDCLEEIGVKIIYDDAKNREYIYRKMNEKGENLCPQESRKFWDFLKTMDERKKNK